MAWTKVVFTLVVLLLYIPMVFMGANVFFTEFTGNDRHFKSECFEGPRLAEGGTEYQKCSESEKAERDKFEEEKLQYNAWKYFAIVLFNLIALLFVVFVTLESSIVGGIFLGSILTTFFATWIYFDTRSKLGFATLVVIFVLVVYFINKKKTMFKFKK